MFDIGWQEFILIALVAVMVVGPKDLPRVIRTVGQWIRKARSLASEFQGSLEEMAREAELDDVRKSIQEASRGGVGAAIEKHVDPGGDIRRSFEDARDSSGADEIEAAVDEARRDTRALASAGPTADGPVATPTPTVKGPAEPTAASPAVAAPAAAPQGEPKPAKAPAKRAASKTSATKAAAASTAPKPAKPKAAAAKPAAADGGSAGAEPAAKPKRAARKPAAGKAGEA